MHLQGQTITNALSGILVSPSFTAMHVTYQWLPIKLNMLQACAYLTTASMPLVSSIESLGENAEKVAG